MYLPNLLIACISLIITYVNLLLYHILSLFINMTYKSVSTNFKLNYLFFKLFNFLIIKTFY